MPPLIYRIKTTERLVARPSCAETLRHYSLIISDSTHNVGTVADWLTAHNFSMPTYTLHKSYDEGLCIMESFVSIAHFIAVGARVNLQKLIPGQPQAVLLRRWVKERFETMQTIDDE